ncbi:hypothetical protein OV208_15405 [Corallococcus sp. bb12-1]|uniref:hypothetical protein n=1 Tax=Corallococcus sp. bb12-1 TaxID=2996784 RepID=UPI00226D66BA|nr:hypothetical protein [Corallococcus sp. bb12-1]MCY1042710.1 hypothetical protein [Corallococcus sp. bb12-1]
MRVHLIFIGLLSLSACNQREKDMEQERIAYIQKMNEKDGDGEHYWEATGEKHSTWMAVRNYGPMTPEQIREDMLKSMQGLDAGKEEMERDGFTHIGIRDRDTNVMMTKPVTELRGMAAAFVDGADDKPTSPVPPWAPKAPAIYKDAKQAYCPEKGSSTCCSYINSKCVFILCRRDNFREWKEIMDRCK